MQLPDELNSKRQDPEDEYKTKMYQLLKLISTGNIKKGNRQAQELREEQTGGQILSGSKFFSYIKKRITNQRIVAPKKKKETCELIIRRKRWKKSC